MVSYCSAFKALSNAARNSVTKRGGFLSLGSAMAKWYGIAGSNGRRMEVARCVISRGKRIDDADPQTSTHQVAHVQCQAAFDPAADGYLVTV